MIVQENRYSSFFIIHTLIDLQEVEALARPLKIVKFIAMFFIFLHMSV
jgi:hypothetical protein